jgi:hypothetical protein
MAQVASVTPRGGGEGCWVRLVRLGVSPKSLTKVGSFGPDKMEALLNKHERTNCVGLESSTSERDGVPPT